MEHMFFSVVNYIEHFYMEVSRYSWEENEQLYQ